MYGVYMELKDNWWKEMKCTKETAISNIKYYISEHYKIDKDKVKFDRFVFNRMSDHAVVEIFTFDISVANYTELFEETNFPLSVVERIYFLNRNDSHGYVKVYDETQPTKDKNTRTPFTKEKQKIVKKTEELERKIEEMKIQMKELKDKEHEYFIEKYKIKDWFVYKLILKQGWYTTYVCEDRRPRMEFKIKYIQKVISNLSDNSSCEFYDIKIDNKKRYILEIKSHLSLKYILKQLKINSRTNDIIDTVKTSTLRPSYEEVLKVDKSYKERLAIARALSNRAAEERKSE